MTRDIVIISLVSIVVFVGSILTLIDPEIVFGVQGREDSQQLIFIAKPTLFMSLIGLGIAVYGWKQHRNERM